MCENRVQNAAASCGQATDPSMVYRASQPLDIGTPIKNIIFIDCQFPALFFLILEAS